MNDILRKTHQNSNINLLKARDTFFDRARKRYKYYLATVFLPIIIATLTYVPIIYIKYPIVSDSRDFIIGISSILFLIIGKLISDKNENDTHISNMLREYYDCKIYNMKENPLIYDFKKLFDGKGNWKPEIVEAWEMRKDHSNGVYENWYGEVFSNNKNLDILSFQMDNVIYTYHVYKEYLKVINIELVLTYFIIIAILIFSIFVWKQISVFILMMFSIASAVQMLLDMKTAATELISKNKSIYDYVKNNVDFIKQQLSKSDEFLRRMQDVIANNRDKGLFIPQKVRNVYLIKDYTNPYFRQFNELLNVCYKGMDFNIPEKASDIEVFSSTSSKPITSLDKIQKRLLTMLIDLDKVLKKYNIHYILDGGTLIGAVRRDEIRIIDKKNGKFIFWDDDIDLSISYKDIDRFVKVVNNELKDKYEVQTYKNDLFYSPRLSCIRLREKNSKSMLYEKDSELFEKYKYRGLFIDIYAYCPTLKNIYIDSIYRKMFIHPLNIKLRNVESKWKHDKKYKKQRYEKKFIRLKEIYLKRVNWYLDNIDNEEYYTSTPNYINDLKNPGPYLKKDAILGKPTYANFMGKKFQIPTDTDSYLTAFYGDNWYKSPYKSKKELIKKYKNEKWLAAKVMHVTPLKHYKFIEKFK